MFLILQLVNNDSIVGMDFQCAKHQSTAFFTVSIKSFGGTNNKRQVISVCEQAMYNNTEGQKHRTPNNGLHKKFSYGDKTLYIQDELQQSIGQFEASIKKKSAHCCTLGLNPNQGVAK